MTKAYKTIQKIAGKEPIAAAIVLGSGPSAIGDVFADKVAIPCSELGGFLGMKVWACSSVTNMGAGLSTENISHEHTKTMAVLGAEKPALVEDL